MTQKKMGFFTYILLLSTSTILLNLILCYVNVFHLVPHNNTWCDQVCVLSCTFVTRPNVNMAVSKIDIERIRCPFRLLAGQLSGPEMYCVFDCDVNYRENVNRANESLSVQRSCFYRNSCVCPVLSAMYELTRVLCWPFFPSRFATPDLP